MIRMCQCCANLLPDNERDNGAHGKKSRKSDLETLVFGIDVDSYVIENAPKFEWR